jgi:hypothetical protein
VALAKWLARLQAARDSQLSKSNVKKEKKNNYYQHTIANQSILNILQVPRLIFHHSPVPEYGMPVPNRGTT